MSSMTDITRLLASLKRRSAHAKEFGHDVLFVKLVDIDALVEALEKAQETIAFQQGEIKALLSSLESRTVTVKLPQAVSAGGQGYQEQVERILTAAGIKWEAE
ncbi:hypothetical protein [Klebsiella aerogenes]|uniref:hypothetical protein n=1 Tax=Klebsiella aerogenes TaxID=548 RepID=UPI0027ED0468|nr:hypothetical protein [Klebsiella aerogenes]